MLSLSSFSDNIVNSCKATSIEFLGAKDVSITVVNPEVIFEEISGPSIEVRGKKIHYSCILEYKADQSLQILDLFSQNYPFLNKDELPELDLLDLLGEFLNILSGKINKELESIEGDLSIEIPYFEYGIDVEESQQFGSIECLFDNVKFNIHFVIN